MPTGGCGPAFNITGISSKVNDSDGKALLLVAINKPIIDTVFKKFFLRSRSPTNKVKATRALDITVGFVVESSENPTILRFT